MLHLLRRLARPQRPRQAGPAPTFVLREADVRHLHDNLLDLLMEYDDYEEPQHERVRAVIPPEGVDVRYLLANQWTLQTLRSLMRQSLTGRRDPEFDSMLEATLTTLESQPKPAPPAWMRNAS